MPTQHDLVRDQFTKQAVPFSTAPAIADEAALRRVVAFSGAGPKDTLLDVACGPGLVVCAFARTVRHATGIDLTPAMLGRAAELAREQGLTNVAWHLGDVLPLPFPDGAFSIVTSRYAFHHMEDPGAVLAEMRRVCAPGGRVLVIDLLAPEEPAKAAALNRMEKLRDASHTRALRPSELRALFVAAGLGTPDEDAYRLELELEAVLARSFMAPGDDERVRRLFADAVADDGLGLGTRRDERGRIRFGYPVAVLRATR